MATSLSPETLDVLSRQAAGDLIHMVADAGGEVHDLMTVLTSTAAQVIRLALPAHADAQTVEKLARMTGEMLALRRQIDFEDAAVRQ